MQKTSVVMAGNKQVACYRMVSDFHDLKIIFLNVAPKLHEILTPISETGVKVNWRPRLITKGSDLTHFSSQVVNGLSFSYISMKAHLNCYYYRSALAGFKDAVPWPSGWPVMYHRPC